MAYNFYYPVNVHGFNHTRERLLIPLIIGLVVVYAISPLARVIVKNLHLIGVYSFTDLYLYIKLKKYAAFNYFGIDCFCGMFGHGKTLTMCHRAREIYNQFGDRIRFISNVDLVNIPYTPLVNFNQLVDLGEDETNYEGTVVLIDEVENVLNNRNFAKFPLALLHVINQQRKKHVYIMMTSPRFFQIDKMMRQITTSVYCCDKYWRFQHVQRYDAWDYENAMNTRDIKRVSNVWFFVKNQDYNTYNTEQMISKDSAENFISNEESLKRIGDAVQNSGAVINRSKKSIRQNKRNKK